MQAAANNKKCSAEQTWDAINREGASYGAPYIDIDRFMARYEADPVLQQIVDRYDENGLVVKTNQHVSNPITQHTEPEPENDTNASRAKEALKRIKK